MSSNIFDKILRIVSIVVSVLQMALKAFAGLDNDGDDDDDNPKD